MTRTDRYQQLARIIADATDQPSVEIVSAERCGGGCIHQAEQLTLSDGRKFFVKSNRDARDMFEKEAEGLQSLAAANTLRLPHVIGLGCVVKEDALILEFIPSGMRTKDFFFQFGTRLAELHRQLTADWFGWHTDNFLGSTPQKNPRTNSWSEFFAVHRLQSQLQLAERSGNHDGELSRAVSRICDKLESLLSGPREPACLIHGDLWSGNFLCDAQGQAVIFDPAVYFAHREAELAMPLLFGGFPQEFFAGYDEAWPLAAGWRDRVELYKLYHLLNHLNLFGRSYLQPCLEIARRFA
ncbi:MAG: fructosamine kinase family protein [bacterium]|nr:fructosamine kinase family protein [bacterium]